MSPPRPTDADLFMRCRFTDVAHVLVSITVGYVVRDLRKEGLVAEYPDVVPPGWRRGCTSPKRD